MPEDLLGEYQMQRYLLCPLAQGTWSSPPLLNGLHLRMRQLAHPEVQSIQQGGRGPGALS